MKVLVTGPFGNIGQSTLDELLRQGHQVRCFDIKTKANEKTAKKYDDKIGVVWGDIRKPEDVAKAVEGQDVVIHMCFIIPTTMSITGISSEDKPEWAEAINVGGTKNVVDAMKSMSNRPKLIFSSSTQVFGHTQQENRPRCASDAVCATDHYTDHKLRCEEIIKSSGLDWVILRFTAVLATKVGMNPDMFDEPLDMRMEFIHTKDVGAACAHSVTCDEAVGKILLIGGGRTCQLTYREMVGRGLEAFGVGRLPDKAFTKEPFAQDWADTAESQRMLQYQQRSYADWLEDIKREAGYKRHLARMFRPVARWYLMRKSPYY